MMGVYEKLCAGDYDPKSPRPNWGGDAKYDGVWEAQRKTYQEEHQQLDWQFQQDAMAELGLDKHPRGNDVWRLAWEQGHSSGLVDVWLHLDELARLVLPVEGQYKVETIIPEPYRTLAAAMEPLNPADQTALMSLFISIAQSANAS